MYKSQVGREQRSQSVFMKSDEQSLNATIALLTCPRVKVYTQQSLIMHPKHNPNKNMLESHVSLSCFLSSGT